MLRKRLNESRPLGTVVVNHALNNMEWKILIHTSIPQERYKLCNPKHSISSLDRTSHTAVADLCTVRPTDDGLRPSQGKQIGACRKQEKFTE